MTEKKKIISDTGFAIALATVCLWGLLSVVERSVILSFKVNGWAFVLVQLITASIALIYAGKNADKGGTKYLKHSFSWIFGVLRIFESALAVFIMLKMTATELWFLSRIVIPISLILSFIFLRRKPGLKEIPGLLILLSGLCFLFLNSTAKADKDVFILVFILGFCVSAMALLMERHPGNRTDFSFKSRCYFTGIILLVSSVCILVFLVAAKTMSQHLPYALTQTFPSFYEIISLPVIVSGISVGLTVRMSTMFLYFWGIGKLSSDYFFIATSISPFIVCVFEYVAMPFIGESINLAEPMTLLAGTPVFLGSMAMYAARKKTLREDKEKN